MDTPISVLQDFCARCLDNKGPDYQLLSSDSLVHKPTFTYRVEVGGIIITASGQSKKKAKHAAAFDALTTLVKKYPDEETERYIKETSFLNDDSSRVSGEGEEVNAVGKLQELCMKKKWRPPHYDPIEENSSQHDRSFKVICTIDAEGTKFCSHGYGRSKKLAKRSAAIEMLGHMEKTSNLPRDFLAQSLSSQITNNSSNVEKSQNLEDFCNRIPASMTHSSKSAAEKVVEFYRSLDNELNQVITTIIEKPPEEEPESTLSLISDYIECNVKFAKIPCKKGYEDLTALVVHLVPVDTYHYPIPIITAWGLGPDEQAAKNDASLRAIKTFDALRNYYCEKDNQI